MRFRQGTENVYFVRAVPVASAIIRARAWPLFLWFPPNYTKYSFSASKLNRARRSGLGAFVLPRCARSALAAAPLRVSGVGDQIAALRGSPAQRGKRPAVFPIHCPARPAAASLLSPRCVGVKRLCGRGRVPALRFPSRSFGGGAYSGRAPLLSLTFPRCPPF